MSNRVDPKLLEQAKERYFNNEPVNKIAKSLGINRNTLQNYVNQTWKSERRLQAAELFQELASVKKSQFLKMTQSAIVVLTRALEDISNRDTPPTMKEAKDVSAILDSLDKITRLDENKPTEITASEKPITVIELKEKLKVDPFLEIEDVDYEETNSKDSKENH